MPIVESNAHWTVRLFTDDVIQFGTTHFPGSYFGVYVDEIAPTSNRRHYHIAVSFNRPVTNKELTAMLDKAFPTLRGNVNRSKKQWRTGNDLTKDEFIQYLYKSGEPRTWGHRDDWPGDEYFEEQSMIKAAEIAKSKVKAKSQQGQLPDVITQVLADVKAKRHATGCDHARTDVLLEEVVDAYFAYHERHRKRLKGTYMMRTDIENIMFYTGCKMFRREWKNGIMFQISRNLEFKISDV